MDENNLRFTTNQRLQMITLANFLNDEGKHDSALKVLNRCLEVMPKEHVPYEPLMAYMVESFYVAKGIDQANKISKILLHSVRKNLNFILH